MANRKKKNYLPQDYIDRFHDGVNSDFVTVAWDHYGVQLSESSVMRAIKGLLYPTPKVVEEWKEATKGLVTREDLLAAYDAHVKDCGIAFRKSELGTPDQCTDKPPRNLETEE